MKLSISLPGNIHAEWYCKTFWVVMRELPQKLLIRTTMNKLLVSFSVSFNTCMLKTMPVQYYFIFRISIFLCVIIFGL